MEAMSSNQKPKNKLPCKALEASIIFGRIVGGMKSGPNEPKSRLSFLTAVGGNDEVKFPVQGRGSAASFYETRSCHLQLANQDCVRNACPATSIL